MIEKLITELSNIYGMILVNQLSEAKERIIALLNYLETEKTKNP